MSGRAFFCSAIGPAIITFMMLSCSQTGHAAPDSTGTESFMPPTPVGGVDALAANIIYPDEAKRQGIEGKVVVEVEIGADGKVKMTIVKTGVRDDLDKAAIYAICATNWTAPLLNGKPVSAKVMIPINFRLGEKKK